MKKAVTIDKLIKKYFEQQPLDKKDKSAVLHEVIRRDYATWQDIYLHGCSDPFWPDGLNLNLTPVRAVVMHSGDTLYKPEAWLRVVDSVYAQAAEYERAVAKYFFAGHSRIETQMKYNISERNVYYICDDIRAAGVEIACQLGLVSVI